MIDASQVPMSDWDRAPWNRWAFQHVAEILPTAVISRGTGPVREFSRHEVGLDGLAVTGFSGEATTLSAFLEDSFTDGFLVLREGAIVFERYFNGMDEGTLHLSQSVAKSFTGVLAGILAGRGVIDPSALLTAYVPELEATGYAGATVRHVLDMTSGVRFTEDYTDPYSDMGRADVASGWKRAPEDGRVWPGSMLELVLSLTAERPHGGGFSYRSIETDVLAMVLERAAGKRLPQLLSEEIWSKLGMERDGCITVDRDGFALADGGLNACLRDYPRFGQMVLEGGAWVEATRAADHAAFGEPYTAVLPGGAYRNQFWVEDAVGRNLMARGVFGQLVYVDFGRRIVVVKLSSWPEFVNPGWTKATLEVVRAIGRELGAG